jgi:hypothetical protein
MSREVRNSTRRVLKAVTANSEDLEALWRALAAEEK